MSDAQQHQGERVVCTGCPLVCDDILLTADVTAADTSTVSFLQACGAGAAWLSEACAHDTSIAAMVDGETVSLEAALALAAKRLAGCRRVLVTGCWDTTLESVAVAATLAERLGGAFDTATGESAWATGPIVARTGRITADFEELRARADCVLLWFVDPGVTHPRFVERFLTPTVDGRPRRVFAVGIPVAPLGLPGCVEVAVPPSQSGEAATTLQLMLQERLAAQTRSADCQPTSRQALEVVLAGVADACQQAACVGVVTAGLPAELSGIAAASVAQLVAAMAHRQPAFEVPLSAAGGGAGPAAASAVSTWRFGAAGAVARADRLGGGLAPGEADVPRLIGRGEVDGVLVVGGASEASASAVASFAGPLVTVGGSHLPSAGPHIWINAAPTSLSTAGKVLRDDGRMVELRAVRPVHTPAVATVLTQLLRELSPKERP